MNDMTGISQVKCGIIEASRRGVGSTRDGSDPEIAYTIGGLRVSVPMDYTSKVARGAASELIASAHLMSLGYHVFRALAASCPVDLVAYRPGEPPLRVEVKTAILVPAGTNYARNFPRPSNDDWDLLAVVERDGLVTLLTWSEDIETVKQSYWAALGVTPAKAVGTLTHCHRGHEFTPENVRMTSVGTRTCKPCEKLRYRGAAVADPIVEEAS